MGTVTICNLDDEVIDRIRQQAKARNRSLEAELCVIITRAVEPDSVGEFFKLADEIAERTRSRLQTDSAVLQREGRGWLDRKVERLADCMDELTRPLS